MKEKLFAGAKIAVIRKSIFFFFFKPTFHGQLSLVGGKLFLGAKIAVLMQYEELHDFVQLILSLAATELAQIPLQESNWTSSS